MEGRNIHDSPLHPEHPPSTPAPSLLCVAGMLRVVTHPVNPPPSVQPPIDPSLSLHTVSDEPLTAKEHPLLTQKQVRELRRLCRKTANRAEFDDRMIQVRQIASIAAMGANSVQFFDPHNPQSGAALRVWVDQQREQGADWRDERPLPDDAIDQLRAWDRALKAWARLRFETSPSRSTAHPRLASTLSRPPGFDKASSPSTPYTGKNRKSSSEYSQFSSPVSPDTTAVGLSPVHTATFSPVQAGEDALSKRPIRVTRSAVKRQPLSEVSIRRVGDTINITVPSIPMAEAATVQDVTAETHPRNIARDDQENVYPSMTKKQTYLHAANTAKSWRNTSSAPAPTEYSLNSDKEMAYRAAAKTLLAGPSKETVKAPNSTIACQTTQRSNMDWGKLRRPVLRTLSLNSNMGNQSVPKTSN